MKGREWDDFISFFHLVEKMFDSLQVVAVTPWAGARPWAAVQYSTLWVDNTGATLPPLDRLPAGLQAEESRDRWRVALAAISCDFILFLLYFNRKRTE